MFQTANYLIKYVYELLHNAQNLANSLKNTTSNPQVSNYLTTNRIYPSSAMGLLGVMFYDMATSRGSYSQERETVRRNSSRIILLTDIVDDIIDQRPTPLKDKFTFLDNVKSDLFGHSTHSSKDVQEEASYVLARSIYTEFLYKDTHKKTERIFDKLVDVIKRQFIETDENKLLKLATITGACLGYSVEVITEIATNRDFPNIREAAKKMGEYGEIIDNLYELDKDLTEGVNTFPTVTIRKYGDSRDLRRKIGRSMLQIAEESIKTGFTYLKTDKQRTIYRIIKSMLDLKYKVVDKLHK